MKRENCLTFAKMPLNIMFSMCQENMGIILISQLLLSYYKRKGVQFLNDIYLFNASINSVPYFRDLYLYYSADTLAQHPALQAFPGIVCEQFRSLSKKLENEPFTQNGCLSH